MFEMIIPRKYEWLGVLYEKDPVSRDLIDKAFAISNCDPEIKEELLKYNQCNIPAFMNIGCGIPGQSYAFFMEGFEKLDESNPYDNDLTFNDVTRIEYETSRKGFAIQMRFVNEACDSPYRIVGFAAIKNNKGRIKTDTGWNMIAPFEIG